MPFPWPPQLQVFVRDWLSANNVLLRGRDGHVLVDSGYVRHAPLTLALLASRQGLDGDVLAALSDDLNTPFAIARLHEEVRELNTTGDPTRQAQLKAILLMGGALLGLLTSEPNGWLQSGVDTAATEDRVQRWASLRAHKNFAAADALRAELNAEGISVSATPGGPRWTKS